MDEPRQARCSLDFRYRTGLPPAPSERPTCGVAQRLWRRRAGSRAGARRASRCRISTSESRRARRRAVSTRASRARRAPARRSRGRWIPRARERSRVRRAASGRPWSRPMRLARDGRGARSRAALAARLPAPRRRRGRRARRAPRAVSLSRSRRRRQEGRPGDSPGRRARVVAIDARDDADAAARRRRIVRMSRRKRATSPTRRRTPTRASARTSRSRARWWSARRGPDEHPHHDEHLPLYAPRLARRAHASTRGKRLLLVGGSSGRLGACRATSTSSPTPAGARTRRPSRASSSSRRSRARFSGRPRARGRGGVRDSLHAGTVRVGVIARRRSERRRISRRMRFRRRLSRRIDGLRDASTPSSRTARPRSSSFEHRAAFVLRVRSLDRAPSGNAMERDFTVNALAYDVGSRTATISSGHGRRADARVARGIGPARSFREDPARMRRAVRAACRHEFRLAANVARAIRSDAHEIRRVPSARVAGELRVCARRGRRADPPARCGAGLLEHVMHAHATYVARAVNPETNFVAAPPGAFPELGRRIPTRRRRSSGSSERRAPWDAKTRRRRGSRSRGTRVKRVSDATTKVRLFETDPMFRVPRVGRHRVAERTRERRARVRRAAARRSVEEIGMAADDAEERGKRADAVPRRRAGAAAMRAYDDAARGADPSDDRSSETRRSRLAANAGRPRGRRGGGEAVEKTIEREKTIEGEGDGRRADGGRGRRRVRRASASLTAEERWSLGWVAWTAEEAHVAKVKRDEVPCAPANPHATVCSASAHRAASRWRARTPSTATAVPARESRE